MSELVQHNPCDIAIARNVAGRAIAALMLGWGVGRVSAIRDGNVLGECVIQAPETRTAFQNAADGCVVTFAGRLSCLIGNDWEDTERLSALAASVTGSSREAQALLDFAHERAVSLVDSVATEERVAKLVQALEASGGAVDFNHDAVRDFSPLVEVHTAPIHITMPPQPAPNVTVNVDPTPVTVEVAQPDKTVVFHRDGAGQIVEATTEPAVPA